MNPRGLFVRNTEDGGIAADDRLTKISILFDFVRFKTRAKFTVADESSWKFSVLYESVVYTRSLNTLGVFGRTS